MESAARTSESVRLATKDDGMGTRDRRIVAGVGLYSQLWRSENAAGLGRERGRTGSVAEDPAGAVAGRRGSLVQTAARSRAWIGKTETESECAVEEETARTWVGTMPGLLPGRTGTVRADGRRDRGIELGT